MLVKLAVLAVLVSVCMGQGRQRQGRKGQGQSRSMNPRMMDPERLEMLQDMLEHRKKQAELEKKLKEYGMDLGNYGGQGQQNKQGQGRYQATNQGQGQKQGRGQDQGQGQGGYQANDVVVDPAPQPKPNRRRQKVQRQKQQGGQNQGNAAAPAPAPKQAPKESPKETPKETKQTATCPVERANAFMYYDLCSDTEPEFRLPCSETKCCEHNMVCVINRCCARNSQQQDELERILDQKEQAAQMAQISKYFNNQNADVPFY